MGFFEINPCDHDDRYLEYFRGWAQNYPALSLGQLQNSYYPRKLPTQEPPKPPTVVRVVDLAPFFVYPRCLVAEYLGTTDYYLQKALPFPWPYARFKTLLIWINDLKVKLPEHPSAKSLLDKLMEEKQKIVNHRPVMVELVARK